MSITALCSVTHVMMWLPFSRYISATPLIARLFDSVAPLVKMISFGFAPIRSATCLRAVSTASSASQPNAWLRLAGVAEVLGEVRQHRLEHPRIDGRRGVIVHVDRKLHRHPCRGPPRTRACCTPRLRTTARATGTGEDTFSAAISAMRHGARASPTIRSRICHSGSRMLHLLNCSQSCFSVEQAVTVNGPSIASNDVGHADRRRRPAQRVAAARALRRDQQPDPDQPLQHLGHQLDRDVVLLRDLARARRRRRRCFWARCFIAISA